MFNARIWISLLEVAELQGPIQRHGLMSDDMIVRTQDQCSQ